MKKTYWLLLFCLAWFFLRLPSLLFPQDELNGDVSVHLLMALDWFQGGASRYMWGQNYLGTLENLWGALWFKVLPLKFPYLYLPTALLALLADLLFLSLASRVLPVRSLIFLILFLLFAPHILVDEQILPAFSYSIVSILGFLAIAALSPLARGFCLGLAFYVQPISVYFTVPLIFYELLNKNWRRLGWIALGALPPLLFAYFSMTPIDESAGASERPTQYYFYQPFRLILSFFVMLFGYPVTKHELTTTPSFIALAGGFTLGGLFVILFLAFPLKRIAQWSRGFGGLLTFVMLCQLILIPVLFMIKSYSGFDGYTNRYLWLWHYPVYFFAGWILGKWSQEGMGKRAYALLILLCLTAGSLWGKFQLLKSPNPNQIFRAAVDYLRDQRISGVMGDYWAVYPIALLTRLDGPMILPAPLHGSIERNRAWSEEVGQMPRVAYLCLKAEPWCEKPAPEEIEVLGSKFKPDLIGKTISMPNQKEDLLIRIYSQSSVHPSSR